MGVALSDINGFPTGDPSWPALLLARDLQVSREPVCCSLYWVHLLVQRAVEHLIPCVSSPIVIRLILMYGFGLTHRLLLLGCIILETMQMLLWYVAS